MPAKDEADIPSRESSEYENVDVEKAQSGPEMDVEEAVEKVGSHANPAPTLELTSIEEPENTQDDIGSELEKHLSRKSSRKHRLTPEVYPVMDLENNLVGWESQDDPTHPR